MTLRLFIHRLERFSETLGMPVVRNSLTAGVLGRLDDRRIELRAGLSLEQELLTLVHEMTHLMNHCNANPPINRTVCEYEAEAVERWVGSVLKVAPHADDAHDPATITDDLLACSVVRVRRTAHMLLRVAQGSVSLSAASLQSQAAVEVDAPAGEEVIFDDELRGLRDLIGLTQPL
jgi:hypothetical protein